MFNQKQEREKFDYRFNGMYRGVVIDVDDPKDAGRVRIRVHSVYDGVEDNALPWAQYADPFFMTGNDSGSQITPDVGDRLWLFFEEGDHMYPVFFAGAPSAKDLPSEASTTNRVIKTKKGHIVEIDDTDGNERIKLTHSTGTYLEMNDAGELGIDVVSNASLVVNGNNVEHITGDVTVSVDGTVTKDIVGTVDITSSGVEWKAPTLDLGEGGLEPMVLGDKLAAWAESLVQWLDTHQSIGNLGAPTSAPIVPNQPTSEPAIFSGGNVYSTKNRSQ